jgi:hypothetical protein
MIHQEQTLKLIDRSVKNRKIPKYTKLVFGIIFFPGLIGLVIAVILKGFPLQISLLFAGALIIMAIVIAVTSTSLNDKYADIDTESIVLEQSQIKIKSIINATSFEIPIQKGLKITIEYFGTDESPQHWINFSRHKTGGNNFITIENIDGTFIKKEFYNKNISEIKRLRNNLDYYNIQGVETTILNKKHNH